MSDFNDNWQLTGSSDPATPDIQPHQVQTPAPAAPQPQTFAQPYQPQAQVPVQPVAQPVTAQPVYQAPVAQPVQYQPVYQQPLAQPVPGQTYAQPVAGQPIYQAAAQGYVYPAQPVQFVSANFAAEREKNLNECTRMINHFSPKVDLYQDYEKTKTDIVRYTRYSVAPLVWGIILSVFSLVFLFTTLTASYKDTIITYAIITGVFFLFGAGLIVLFFVKKSFNKKKVEELYVKLGEISTQLNILYNGFSNCVIPPEYSDPRILLKIQSLIISGRCVTIGNAINLLLSTRNTYMRISQAKAQFDKDTAERFDGKPLFFNAVRYLNTRI